MTFEIIPYTEDLVPSVRQFNARLAQAGLQLTFPEQAAPLVLQRPGDSRPPYQEQYLVVDDRGTVRGGYILKHQPFRVGGSTVTGGMLRWPLSEGIVDRRYAILGPLIIRHAVRTLPNLMAVGMGGADEPLPRMLRALHWSVWPIPFLFRVIKPARFLRGMPVLRRSRTRNAMLDLLARTGVGAAAIHTVQGVRSLGRPRLRHLKSAVSTSVAPDFGAWADDIWDATAEDYWSLATRDAHTLNRLYPPGDDRIIRLHVAHGGRTLGWAVVIDTAMNGHRHFGDLRVGTIADCLARAADVPDVVYAAVTYLSRAGVDLVITNQAHPAWCRAFEGAGFLPGPSNFALGISGPFRDFLGTRAVRDSWHSNRGDGDGPVNV